MAANLGMECWVAVILLALLLQPTSAHNSDRYALLAFKAAISSDPLGTLGEWDPSDALHCRWNGVLCSTIEHEHRVVGINLPDKSLSGSIPRDLQALSQLQRINLRNNSFSGGIPQEITRIQTLHKMILGNNRLSGALPRDLAALVNLEYIDLSNNLLEGAIPPGLGGTKELEHLNLSGNILSGHIPQNLSTASLDLSRNNLSGPIPRELHGVPRAAFNGNAGLCGAPLRRPCGAPAPRASHRAVPSAANGKNSRAAKSKGQGLSVKEILAIVVGDAVGIVLLGLVFIYCFRRNRICRYLKLRHKNRGARSPGGDSSGSSEPPDHCCLWGICCCCCGDGSDWLGDESGTEGELVLFENDRNDRLTFDLEDLLRASAYVISKGGSGGIVYKAVLESGVTLAVRRLAADSGGGAAGVPRKQKLFDTEVQILGRIRHPCIVKLRAYYSGPDEKLLVYDYIPNGSLATALHGQIAPYSLTSLTWAERVRIARRVSEGLAHIHECGPKKYIHGDIRPKNILLSSNMDAFISDFGLSRLITISGSAENSRSGSRNANTSASLATAAVVLGAAGGTGLNSGVSVEADYSEFRAGHLETEAYRPPEARLASSKPTQKWDVYSFGLVMLELITGKSATQHLKQQELQQWQLQFQQHLIQQQMVAASSTNVGSSNGSTTPPSTTPTTAPTTPPTTPAATPSTPRTPSTPTPTPTTGSKAATPTTTAAAGGTAANTAGTAASETMPLVEWAHKMWEGKRPVFELLDPTLMHGIAPQQRDVSEFLRIALSCVALASEQRPKMRHVCEALKKIGGA
ncbi:receptor protein kinase-like protein ZAR1 [Selaginella moellendorffii]|uniref:receptor protein kinase-like protein ZAR1 n=1 Tax=Selaginella moellendorffii TaxID=88036 RepID=UPI000D1CD9BD|nr:receptor protein kinase-like protein ZAR1 [Selaginella moellendorffii]|eukprot:XP_024517880.1 receptor protein kinase-like protein ZAR1 [Selaginella moellendorffii]